MTEGMELGGTIDGFCKKGDWLNRGVATDSTEEANLPRMTTSTRRFCARLSGVALSRIGWYCANPAAERRGGENPYCTMNKRTNAAARAVDNSQLSLKRGV